MNHDINLIVWCAVWLLCAAMTSLCWFAAYCGWQNKRDKQGTFACVLLGVILQIGILNGNPSHAEAEGLAIWGREPSVPKEIRKKVFDLGREYPDYYFSVSPKQNSDK